MLQIVVTVVPEQWDAENDEFIPPKTQTLQLEHSLVSISKWEAKWCKPFLHTNEKSLEETIDYIKCMTITQNVKPEVYERLSQENVNQINEYIAAPMTATTFSDDKKKKGKQEIITSELIYYWMVALNIPFDPCQKWHLARLITLVRVCQAKNEPPKKGGNKRNLAAEYARLNAERRKALNTTG